MTYTIFSELFHFLIDLVGIIRVLSTNKIFKLNGFVFSGRLFIGT